MGLPTFGSEYRGTLQRLPEAAVDETASASGGGPEAAAQRGSGVALTAAGKYSRS